MIKRNVKKGIIRGSITFFLLAIFLLTSGCYAKKEKVKSMNAKLELAKIIDNALYPVASLESERLYFFRPSSRVLFKIKASENLYDLYLFSLKEGKESKILSNFKGPPEISIAPDGFYFIQNREVYFFKSGEKKPQRLGIKNYDSVYASPDGQKLLLVRSEEKNVFDLYYVNKKGLKNLSFPSKFYSFNPSWISNEEIIFDVAFDEPKGKKSIYSLNINSQKETKIIENCEGPAISPQGLLACLESNQKTHSLSVFDHKLSKIASIEPKGDFEFFDLPITWISNNKLAVTEVTPDEKNTIKIFKLEIEQEIK